MLSDPVVECATVYRSFVRRSRTIHPVCLRLSHALSASALPRISVRLHLATVAMPSSCSNIGHTYETIRYKLLSQPFAVRCLFQTWYIKCLGINQSNVRYIGRTSERIEIKLTRSPLVHVELSPVTRWPRASSNFLHPPVMQLYYQCTHDPSGPRSIEFNGASRSQASIRACTPQFLRGGYLTCISLAHPSSLLISVRILSIAAGFV